MLLNKNVKEKKCVKAMIINHCVSFPNNNDCYIVTIGLQHVV